MWRWSWKYQGVPKFITHWSIALVKASQKHLWGSWYSKLIIFNDNEVVLTWDHARSRYSEFSLPERKNRIDWWELYKCFEKKIVLLQFINFTKFFSNILGWSEIIDTYNNYFPSEVFLDIQRIYIFIKLFQPFLNAMKCNDANSGNDENIRISR